VQKNISGNKLEDRIDFWQQTAREVKKLYQWMPTRKRLYILA